jgi:uncharacterized protein YqeY
MDNNNTAMQDNNTQAQGGNSAINTQTSNDGKSVIDYDKIQSMIDKGVQQKENAILKSYFEQQGMSEDEIKTAIGDYKSKKQTQAQAQAGELTKLQNANTELQSRLTNELLSKQAFNDCLDLGVDKNTIPYVIKSADFKDAIDDKGEIKADKVREAVEQVLKDVPAFKGTSNDDKGIKFGVSGEQDDATEQENALRKAFGLSPKK